MLTSAADAQAVQLLFPSVLTIDQLSDVLSALAGHPSWQIDEVEDGSTIDHSLIALRWKVPRSMYLSEVLVFGPMASFPFTRQSPVTALTLRTHPPAKVEPDSRVHLAQMPLFQIEEQRFEYFWTSTQEERQNLLNGEQVHAARARVSCELPRGLVHEK